MKNCQLTTTRPSPEVKLSLSAKNTALTSWHDAVRESVRALKNMVELESFRLWDHENVAGCLTPQLSLILCENQNTGGVEACLVSWLRPLKNLQGRRISLDDTSNVIYPSHFTEERSDFRRCYMVLPSVGARVRKQAREHVESWVLRLRDMYNTAADGGVQQELGEPARCKGCMFQRDDSSSSSSVGAHRSDDLTLHKCALCLQHFHTACSEQMASTVDSFRLTTTITPLSEHGIEPGQIPFALLSLELIRTVLWLYIHIYHIYIISYNNIYIYIWFPIPTDIMTTQD